MKKIKVKVIILLVAIALLLPIPRRLRDGGTIEYNAIIYSIVKVHELNQNSLTGYNDGIKIKILGIEVFNNVKTTMSTAYANTVKDNS